MTLSDGCGIVSTKSVWYLSPNPLSREETGIALTQRVYRVVEKKTASFRREIAVRIFLASL
jgi:hypothetical protein